MPIEEKIKIGADTSGLKEIEQANRKAFSPASMREYKRAGKELERDHTLLTRKIVDLTRAMRGLDKGTEAFKDMRKELKGIQQDAKLVQSAMEAVNRAVQPRAGRGAFVAGLGQGAGLAQYIPTGPGMGARMAGAAIGGMARRGAGMAAAPFAMPGIGGISQALGGIPIVGGALGGALQQAAGYYQEAVGYERAAMAAMPYAGPGRIVRRAPGGEAVGRLRRAQLGATEARQAQVLAAQQRGPLAMAARQEEQEALERQARQRGVTRRDITRMEAQLGRMGVRRAAPGAIGRVMRAGRADPDIRRLRANVDRMVAADRASAEKGLQTADKELAAATAGARVTISRVSGLPGLRAGARLGFGPQQMIQQFAEMMQARGGVAPDVPTGAFRGAMAARVMHGVQAPLAGQFMRMGVPGAGGMGQMDLATVLQTATEQGLKGSQVVEYLKTLTDLGSRAERMGIKISEREVTRTSALLKGIGLQGLQAQRVGGGLQQAAFGLAQRGVSGPLDLLLLRAAGFRPGQGAEGYARAIGQLERPSAEMFETLIGQIVTGAAGVGGPEMQALMTKRALGKVGVTIGMRQARRFVGGYEGGELAPEVRAEYQALIERGERPGAEARMIAAGEVRMRREAPRAVEAAGLEAQRIEAGRRAARFIVGMERNAIKTSNIISNFGNDLQRLNNLVKELLDTADKWTKGGLEEIMAKIAEAIRGAFI